MQVKFKTFRGTWTIWEELFQSACDFATQIGRERLINISHSEDNQKGVVTVWFWSDD